eukprot:3874521-Rhodomonas_salina.4
MASLVGAQRRSVPGMAYARRRPIGGGLPGIERRGRAAVGHVEALDCQHTHHCSATARASPTRDTLHPSRSPVP